MSGATLLRVYRFEFSGTLTWSLLPHHPGSLDKVGSYGLTGVA